MPSRLRLCLTDEGCIIERVAAAATSRGSSPLGKAAGERTTIIEPIHKVDEVVTIPMEHASVGRFELLRVIIARKELPDAGHAVSMGLKLSGRCHIPPRQPALLAL